LRRIAFFQPEFQQKEMQMRRNQKVLSKLSLAMVLAIAAGIAAPRESRAVPVAFTIDPARSSYHIVNVQTDGASPPAPLQDSTILGVNVLPQSAGADTDALSGTINANEAGGVLTFSGTSSIALAANSAGPFLPAANPGTDNLGIVAPGTAAGTIDVALRNWSLTVQAGTATNGQLPSAGSLILATTVGYQQNSASGQATLVGQSGPDVATTPVSLTTSAGVETLILPVIRLPAPGTPGQIYISGTIVATRTVPEPSSVALGAMAIAGMAAARLSRKRNSSFASDPQVRS
jgi:hypothetical protein